MGASEDNGIKRWCSEAMLNNAEDAAIEFTDALRALPERGTVAAEARLRAAVDAIMRISARVLIELEQTGAS
jgi:hypothetical protein